MRRLPPRLRRLTLALAALCAFSITNATPAFATHFRGGQITWSRSASTPSLIHFELTASFRRDGYAGTASDGYPAVGDVIDEDIGATGLEFGDGYGTGELRFKVIASVPAENYLIGRALEPGSNTTTVIDHDYLDPSGTPGSYPGGSYPGGPTPSPMPSPGSLPASVTASIESCCTISTLRNNPDGEYRVESKVTFSGPETSPVSSLKPIINVGTTGVQHFSVAAVAPPGTTRRFRLATAAEDCGGCGESQPTGLTIDPTTGQASLDTTGLPQGEYFASVVVEALAGGDVISTAQQTFLINVTTEADASNAGFYPSGAAPGEFAYTAGGGYPGQNGTTPPDGSVFFSPPGQPFRVKVSASDPTDPKALLHVDHLGLPTGATFTSTDGNPATGLVEWTPAPGQVGDYIVTFTVAKLGSLPQLRGRAAPTPAAGISTQTISYTLKVADDTTPPAVVLAPTPACSTTGALAFTVNDAGVGPATLKTSVDGGAEVSRDATGGHVDLALTDEGRHTVVYRATDLNGNASAPATTTLLTDRTAPVVTITAPASTFERGAVAKATVTATDAGGLVTDPSGAVTLDTSSLGTHTLERTAKDTCGHSSRVVLTYDVVEPGTPITPQQGEQQTVSSTPPPAQKTQAAALKSKLGDVGLPSTKQCLSSAVLKIKVLKKTSFKHYAVEVNGKPAPLIVAQGRKVLKVKLPPKAKKLRVRLIIGAESTALRTYRRCG